MEFNTQLPEGWQQHVNEAYRNSGVIEGVTDINTIIKMAIDGRNLKSDHIRIPSSEATPETKQSFLDEMITKVPELMAAPVEGGDMSAMFERLGRPKKADEYQLGDMPDTVKEKFTGLTEKAFELGISNTQMKGIADTLVSDLNTANDTKKQAMSSEQALMREAWGQTYDQKLASLSHFTKQTGFSDDFVDAVGRGEIDAKNMQALSKVMGSFEGTGIEIGSQPGDPGSGITPMQAEQQLEEIMGNKDSAYYDASNPAHKTTVDKVHELVVAAESGKKQTDADKFRQSLGG